MAFSPCFMLTTFNETLRRKLQSLYVLRVAGTGRKQNTRLLCEANFTENQNNDVARATFLNNLPHERSSCTPKLIMVGDENLQQLLHTVSK